MPHITEDRVLETTTTTGTGALALAGALTGFRTFASVCSVGDTCLYYIEAVDVDGNATGAWETGLGTYSAASTLTRTTVLESNNAGAAVNFAAGTKRVGLTLTAARTLQLDHQLAVTIPQQLSNPTAPAAGNLKFYARPRANRLLLAIQGPSGVDVNLQPALFGNSIAMWLPGTGTTVGINFGTAWTARNAGTGAAQAHPARASTNAMTSLARATFTTGTTATGSSGVQSSGTIAWRGNAAGLGGFFFHSRVGVETTAADVQVLVGLSALNAAITTEPSVQNNTIALTKDSTDTNWFITTRDGATTTKTPTGKAVVAGEILDLFMFAPPNGSNVVVRLVDAVSGVVHLNDVTITANLPANTTFLFAHAQIKSVTGTTGKLLALSRIYIETDL